MHVCETCGAVHDTIGAYLECRDPTPVSMDTVELHGLKWNRCRRCHRFRPHQRLLVPDGSPVVDTNPPFYQYQCRNRESCDAVRRALERLGE